MAAWTLVQKISTTTAGAKTTTTAAPAVGDLIVVFAFNSNRTAAQAPTITDSQSGTYTQAQSGTKRTSLDSHWIFVRNTLIPATTSTTYTSTPVATDTGGGLAVYRVSGMTLTGASAVKQVGKADNQSTGTPSVTMGAAILTTNPAAGLVHTSQTGSTNTAPPTGWSEAYDSGYSTPSSGTEGVHINSGSTLTTVAWTAATTSTFGAMVIELDASVPAGSNPGAWWGGGGISGVWFRARG